MRAQAVGASRTYDALVGSAVLPRIEARALLEHASGRSREWLIAHGDENADAEVAERFALLARRRAAGEPLAYLVGAREFFGRRFELTPAVLIPRPETELLVEWTLRHAGQGARVLDLGVGSGAIAVTLALERSDLQVTATDNSPDAIAVAAGNARLLGAGHVDLRTGDWYAPVSGDERFDVIVSNPPYVAAGDAHLDAGDLRFEPRTALTDEADGLAALRRIVQGAAAHLSSGGWLAVEHGWDQGPAVRRLFEDAGFGDVATLQDAEHRDRMSVGRAPADRIGRAVSGSGPGCDMIED